MLNQSASNSGALKVKGILNKQRVSTGKLSFNPDVEGKIVSRWLNNKDHPTTTSMKYRKEQIRTHYMKPNINSLKYEFYIINNKTNEQLPKYTIAFTKYLQKYETNWGDDTEISTIESRLREMIENGFLVKDNNKKVLIQAKLTECIFFRGTAFDKTKKLGDYSTIINAMAINPNYGGHGYFFIKIEIEPLLEGGKGKTIKKKTGRKRKTIKRKKSNN